MQRSLYPCTKRNELQVTQSLSLPFSVLPVCLEIPLQNNDPLDAGSLVLKYEL